MHIFTLGNVLSLLNNDWKELWRNEMKSRLNAIERVAEGQFGRQRKSGSATAGKPKGLRAGKSVLSTVIMAATFACMGLTGYFGWALVIPFEFLVGCGLLYYNQSFYVIGPTEIGIKRKRFGKSLPSDNPVAFNKEAGYQSDKLTAGQYFIPWLMYVVEVYPWVQIGDDELGLVIAQVGTGRDPGSKTGIYNESFGDFTDIGAFIANGGQKGPQRHVLHPGTVAAIHPIGFIVVTPTRVYGKPIDKDMFSQSGNVDLGIFGIDADELRPVIIDDEAGKNLDGDGQVVAIVTTLEGATLPQNQIAGRLGGFDDIKALEIIVDTELKISLEDIDKQESEAIKGLEELHRSEMEKVPDIDLDQADGVNNDANSSDKKEKLDPREQMVQVHAAAMHSMREKYAAMRKQAINAADTKIADAVFASKNVDHASYQNFQKFIDLGGCMGEQHDPVLKGRYIWNPLCVSYILVKMLKVDQGEVAVIKARVGLPAIDVSDENFKYGKLVKAGHAGIWRSALGPCERAINPHCYEWEIVSTKIITLNWANTTSVAHKLDATLSPIDAKDNKAFKLSIDLQVAIHIPDTEAPKVISAVGSVEHLVTEVLHPAVGNHFRDKTQTMGAAYFISDRHIIQHEAEAHIRRRLLEFDVETKGVFIQDVTYPPELVKILQERELADQAVVTLQRQKIMEETRKEMEMARGIANKQADLGDSEVEITIKKNLADARKEEGRGEKEYQTQIGDAAGASIKSIGLAKAQGYAAQVRELGANNVTVLNGLQALAESKKPYVPEVMVGQGGSVMDALLSIMTTDHLGRPRESLPASSFSSDQKESEEAKTSLKDENLIAAGAALQREFGLLPDVTEKVEGYARGVVDKALNNANATEKKEAETVEY